MVIGSQAVVHAAEADALAAAVQALGMPVYLSGMARGLLGRDHPLQMRHQRRNALREADCVLLAGVPCDFRLDYGKHVRRSATLIAANRSAKDARLNRRPDVAALGDAGPFIQTLAQALPACRQPLGRLVRQPAPARRRARGRDRRPGRGAGRTRQPAGLLPRAGGRGRRQRHLRGRRRRFRGHRQLRAAPAHAAQLAGPGRLRHAGRGRGLCHRRGAGPAAGSRGVDRLGRRRLRLGPGRVRLAWCARASRSSPWSATTPAGRRLRASR